MKDEPDQQRRHDHGEYREADFCALLIEMLEDIAGRARGIDDPGDLVPRDNRHRRKDAYARAPANGVERRLVMPGDTHAQGAAEASLQRLLYFFEMRERQAHLFAAGDDDTIRVEQPKSRERHVLRCDEIGHHARAESDEGGIGRRGRHTGFRPRRQYALVCKFQRRPDRLIGCV